MFCFTTVLRIFKLSTPALVGGHNAGNLPAAKPGHRSARFGRLAPIVIPFLCAATMATPARAVDWNAAIVGSFETLGSDVADIPEKTDGYTVSEWYNYSLGEAAAVGAGACAIPGVGLAAIAAETPYLMREIHNSVLGLGHLIYGPLHEEDFATVISLWGEAFSLTQAEMDQIYEISAELAKEAALHGSEYVAERLIEHHRATGEWSLKAVGRFAAPAVPGASSPLFRSASQRAASRIVTRLVSHEAGVKLGGKLGAKATAKVVAKMSAKLVSKTAASLVPFVGPAICAGVNVWIMKSILDTSWTYYTLKANARARELVD